MSPIARRPRSARCCSRARSIIAPATRWPSFSRSSGSPAPRPWRTMSTARGPHRGAVARTQAASESRWEGADLYAGRRRIGALSGRSQRPVSMPRSGCRAAAGDGAGLALALHELATNAANMARCRPTLFFSVFVGAWQRPGRFVMEGIGRPANRATNCRGYGNRAIFAGIERQLGGIVDFHWQEDGLHCTLSIPHEPQREPEVCTDRPEHDGSALAQDGEPNDNCPAGRRRTTGLDDARRYAR